MRPFCSLFFFVLLYAEINAQLNLYRRFSMPPPVAGSYMLCDYRLPVRTADKGYIFSFNPWAPNLHAAYPIDDYIIKTDSNFVPQWRKHFTCEAVPLPTGGIMIYYSFGKYDLNGFQKTYVQKVTASGVLIWQKGIDADIRINSGVQYGDKVRFVGGKLSTLGFYPAQYTFSNPYTIEVDTAGNIISQLEFTSTSTAEFGRVELDQQGNFYVLGVNFSMVLAKFNSAFQFQWAKQYALSTQPFQIKDIDLLSNGHIMVTGVSRGNYLYNNACMGTVMKLDAQGNLLGQKFLDKRFSISGLCKKPNGHYAVTLNNKNYSADSLFIIDVDNSLTISSCYYLHRGIGVGTPVLKNARLHTTLFNLQPYLISTDLEGENCNTTALTPSILTSQVSFGSMFLTPFTASYSALTQTYNPIAGQLYQDSCVCGPSLLTGDAVVCAGSPVSFTASGLGGLHWYTSPSSSISIGSGSIYTFSSPGPTLVTYYVQDSACVLPIRIPATVSVTPAPNINLTASSAPACAGSTVQLTAWGAGSYTWTNGSTSSVLIVPALSNLVYQVTGINSFSCKGTASLALNVLPTPVLTISATNTLVCAGSSVQLSASGAVYYLWNTGTHTSTLISGPHHNTTFTVTGVGSNGCSANLSIAVSVIPLPIISIVSSQTISCENEPVTITASGGISYTWSNSLTAASFSMFATNTNTYSVVVTNSLGCSAQATFFHEVVPCTGQRELYSGRDVNIFPNPSAGDVYIVSDAAINLELLNEVGQLIQSVFVKGRAEPKATLRGLTPGIYYLHDRNGSAPGKKIVIRNQQ